MKKARILHLSLKREWFDVMVTGDKTLEFRKPSKWIRQRLDGKEYDLVKFTNGYGPTRPYFICEYVGHDILDCRSTCYGKNHVFRIPKGYYMIVLGKIIKKGNILTHEFF